MAVLSSAAVVAAAPCLARTRARMPRSAGGRLVVRASLGRAAGASAVAVAASAMLAGGALAQDVLLGGEGGILVFEPSGVDVSKISQEEYLNAAGDTFSITLTVPGTYSFYCEPHAGAGMVGKVTVN